jgi:hypothetical protein
MSTLIYICLMTLIAIARKTCFLYKIRHVVKVVIQIG